MQPSSDFERPLSVQGAAQRESEEKFRLMADVLPQIIWVTDAEGRVQFFNQQWRDYTGIEFHPATAAEVAAAAVHPDDVALTMARFNEARHTGGTFLVEHRIRSAAGNYRWFLVKAEPYRDPASGAITRWFGSSTDIHDRKQEEEARHRFALRQSFQLALADRIRPLADPEAVIAEASELLGTQLGVTRVIYGETTDGGASLVLHRDWTDGTVPSMAGLQVTLDDYGPGLAASLQAGIVMAVPDVAANEHTAPYRERHEAVAVRAFLAIPLMKHGQLQAILSVHDAAVHHWTANDIDMARDMVDRTWSAVDSARAQAGALVNAERVQLALAAGAIIGTWFWDLRTDRFTVDEAFAEAFGIEPALGRRGLSLAQVVATVHPDDQAGLAQAIGDAIAAGGHYAHQYRVRRADGCYYWIEANGRVDLDAEGKGMRFPGVLIDVENRRAVEAERDRAIVKLRALNDELEQKVMAQLLARGRTWNVSPDILGVLNGAGFFEASNPAWGATLGWSEEEIFQTPFLDLVHPDDRDATRAMWQAALAQNTPVPRFDNRYRHRDGGWRWLSWVAVPEEGKLYCSARDITVVKQAEDELVTRTAERDRMWNSSPDLLLVIDFDGYLRRVNPAWTGLLGYQPDELVGHHVTEFVLPDDHPSTIEAYVGAADGNVARLVNRYRHRNGSLRWISWVGVPAADMTYATGRDVTTDRERQAELEQAQEQLRQSQKMEAVGQLTGGLAHDFNNLLASIMGGLELTGIRLRQNRPDDVERYMGMAMGATRRAAALTHRLLAFSRRQTLAPTPTNVNTLVGGMVDIIRRTVGPGVTVATDCTAAPWTTLVDQSQLENTLLNLCLNARDAMPDGGTITIRTRNHAVTAAEAKQHEMPAGEYLSLSVADTGTGMRAEVRARAFEPFFTTKPLGQGTGLGLSMIYGFARQSGGNARIESTVAEGTEVCILLPRHHGAPEAEAGTPATEPLAMQKSAKTILVVDDEPDVRLLVMDVLKDMGYIAIEASDGAAGLEVLASNARLDLLVSDVGLPGGMNGRQMADAGRVHRPDLKVLFITGYDEAASLDKGQLAPGMAVLTKPFPLEALGLRIREMIG
ncbi:PAS domain S-box-containing protein [Pseudoduganella lurida]|uniref:histidine kinase n=1 Tax=Pseudoduganella lurida TaxID=1036180 RepID=A0A562R8K0_9BURK|nr:PAS domain-containing protein [Pseudoduganella lurida]TWI65399.1 PAS domain S-box-containing protein [Pseudoduganella lurida]